MTSSHSSFAECLCPIEKEYIKSILFRTKGSLRVQKKNTPQLGSAAQQSIAAQGCPI